MYELYNNYDNLYQHRKKELEQNLDTQRKLKAYKGHSKTWNNSLFLLLAFRNLLSK